MPIVMPMGLARWFACAFSIQGAAEPGRIKSTTRVNESFSANHPRHRTVARLPRWPIFFRASDSYQWPKYLKRLKQQRLDPLPSFLTLPALTGDKFVLVHFDGPQVQDRLAGIARHHFLSPVLSSLTPPLRVGAKHTKMAQTPTRISPVRASGSLRRLRKKDAIKIPTPLKTNLPHSSLPA
jgi:hypothetical protein